MSDSDSDFFNGKFHLEEDSMLVLLNYKLIATVNYRFDSIESENLV